YLIATVFMVVAIVGIIGLLFQQLASAKVKKNTDIQPALEEARTKNNEFKRALGELSDATNELGQLTSIMNDRYYWVETLPELKASPFFDPKGTQLGTTIPPEESTFTFAVRITLKTPLKF